MFSPLQLHECTSLIPTTINFEKNSGIIQCIPYAVVIVTVVTHSKIDANLSSQRQVCHLVFLPVELLLPMGATAVANKLEIVVSVATLADPKRVWDRDVPTLF